MKDLKVNFLPYPLALIAKEKGFNGPCTVRYDGWIEEGEQRELKPIVNEMGILSGITNEDLKLTDTVCAPLYQQIVDWFKQQDVKIIENKSFGWDIYTKCSSDTHYDVYKECYNLNQAIEAAFKLI